MEALDGWFDEQRQATRAKCMQLMGVLAVDGAYTNLVRHQLSKQQDDAQQLVD